MRHLFAALCLAAMLPACTTLNPVTAARLSRMNPLTADPAAIAARLTLPEGLAVRPGSAILTISAERKATGEAFTHAFALEQRGSTWRLSPADVQTLRVAQAEAARWKEEAPDETTGSIQLSLGGCAVDEGPHPEATVAADLSLDGGASYAPLIRGVPVARIAAAAGPEAPLPACP
ncbi:hypothetical protein [Vannielia litorea]|uniref:hypothetical protein n=1 Tax=Vannielia litorea TaxID=1217970 RepID=UPI001BD023F0|nr:hypothetical protein [Vannielia litorea]MBS8227228.1 hypothetical protein [Vannielia litorea]